MRQRVGEHQTYVYGGSAWYHMAHILDTIPTHARHGWLLSSSIYSPQKNTGVNITTIQGHRYLGASLGSKSFIEDFIWDKISCWVSEIRRLSEIAKFQPQAAYAVFTHALTSRWTFLMRTAPSIEPLLQPLEEAIRHQFLLAVTGRQGITDLERKLLALPAHHGGLGVQILTRNANNQFKACIEVTAPLVKLISQQNPNYHNKAVDSCIRVAAPYGV